MFLFSISSVSWDVVASVDQWAIRKGECKFGVLCCGAIFNAKYPQINVDGVSLLEVQQIEPKELCVLPIYAVRLEFVRTNVMNMYPTSCPSTSIRFPETSFRLHQETNRIRSWMNLKLLINIPSVLSIVFDEDALETYGRLFSFLFKVGVVFRVQFFVLFFSGFSHVFLRFDLLPMLWRDCGS